MKKDLIVKDNSLINASYYLDLVEQRLILLAIIEARKETNSSELYVHAESYANLAANRIAYPQGWHGYAPNWDS